MPKSSDVEWPKLSRKFVVSVILELFPLFLSLKPRFPPKQDLFEPFLLSNWPSWLQPIPRAWLVAFSSAPFKMFFFVHLFQKNTVDFCKTSIYSAFDGKDRRLVLIWALNPSFFPNCILPPNSQKTARLENSQKSHQTITSGKPSVSAYRQLSASRQLSRSRLLSAISVIFSGQRQKTKKYYPSSE